MNKQKRGKVRRIRTLQAILRGYRLMNQPVHVDDLCYRFEVAADFSYRGLAGAMLPKRQRWHPRRGFICWGYIENLLRKRKLILRPFVHDEYIITQVTPDTYVGPITFNYDPEAYKNLLNGNN